MLQQMSLHSKKSLHASCLDFDFSCGAFQTKLLSTLIYPTAFFVSRKRGEEQRRRKAVQPASLATAEKRRVPVVRTEQEKLSLGNIIEDLSLNDSVGETKKSSKAERAKSKEERLKGTHVQKFFKLL